MAPMRRAMRVAGGLVMWFALTTMWVSAASAQSQNTGTISGNVTDPQGALVVNATVELISVDQGTSVKTAVNARGEYIFSNVKAGAYVVTVSAPSFENYTADSVQVNATENVRLDAKLKSGSSTETVTVDAPSATVDTRSATIATVIDPTLVQDLPVDGNNVVALAALLPGVTNVNAPTTFTSDTGGPTYNISGSRSNQNLFLFDGLMWNNVYYNTGLNYPPPFMLQEVSVQLLNFKAQYGRNVGSVFNALTRSGSNAIHGEVWEYMQNTFLNASDYIFQRNPHLVQNQFGATVGGPIKRDKMFYFLGFQDLRSSAEVDARSLTPTLDERGLTASGGLRPCVSAQFAGMSCASFVDNFTTPALYQEYLNGQTYLNNCPSTANMPTCVGVSRPDWSSTYFATTTSQLNSNYAVQGGTGNSPCLNYLNAALGPISPGANVQHFLPNAEVPSPCWNPVATTVLAKYVPLPNLPADVAGGELATLSSALQPRNDYNGLARVDWNAGHGHTIDSRFYVTNVDDFTSNSVSPTVLSVANYEIDANAAGIYNGNIGDTWVLGANLLNTLRVGYKRYDYTITPTDTTTLIALGGNVANPGTRPCRASTSTGDGLSVPAQRLTLTT